MSYEEFFQLKEQPFSNTPDSRFYFESQQHAQAMLRLLHAARTMKGLALLVGDIGTGKTTLARKMLDNLDERDFESALLVVVHSAITPEWLLRKIALQMGVKDLAGGGETVSEFTRIKYDIGLNDKIFTERYLRSPPREVRK